jgi:adenine phosphoribosyltransferase
VNPKLRSQEETVNEQQLKSYIREIPDFPKPGILYYDITTLLQNPVGLRRAVDQFVWLFAEHKVDKVLGIESRGFLFGPVVAYNLNAGFVPVRKPGKLPWETVEQAYELEYGSDSIEMHQDAVKPGERVLIVDDLIATGGTARAAVQLVESVGGIVSGLGFLVELAFLDGRKKLDGYAVESLMTY